MSGFRASDRIRSFVYALRGLAVMLRYEPNAWIHIVATGVAVAAGFVFGIGRAEWLAITLAIGLVWMAEAFNTALEAVCDALAPEPSPLIGFAKDVAAGAVLLAAVTALAVAAIVFGPRLLAICQEAAGLSQR